MANLMGVNATRIYRNAANEDIRIDSVSVSGYLFRRNIDVLGQGGKVNTTTHMRDWGEWVFHPNGNGRQIGTETFHFSADRVVAEIELLGSFSDYDNVNFDWFEFSSGATNAHRIELTDLPNIGDTV